MSKHLVIVGHGKNRNGSFDPGATSKHIPEGEHRWITNNLIPLMRKYSKDIHYHTSYSVYSHRDINNLQKKYGGNVTELHLDSTSNSNVSGGHVIIHKVYSPDEIDVNLVNALRNTVGVFGSYKHRGIAGLSGRTDLLNVNLARNHGFSYRLIELGFISNKKDTDWLKNNTDKLAQELVKAIEGQITVKQPTKKPTPVKKSTPVKKKTTAVIVKEVIDGKWGNGEERKSRLKDAGYNPTTIQNAVNKKLSPVKKKSNAVIVNEVIAGKWGNGEERTSRLKKAGYNPTTIQNAVNKKLK